MDTTTADTAAIEQTSGDKRDQFHITDEAAANWYARKLANIETERARVKAQAAQILALLDTDEQRLRFRFEAEAREWARGELERRFKGRRRSLPLLQGTFAFRQVPAALRLDDEAAALDYAERRAAFKGNPEGTGPADFPNCAPLVPVLDAATYRQAAANWFEQTGELLPGVASVPERETFAVRFTAGERFGKDSGNDGKEEQAGS